MPRLRSIGNSLRFCRFSRLCRLAGRYGLLSRLAGLARNARRPAGFPRSPRRCPNLRASEGTEMTKRIIFLGLVMGMLTASSGCGLCHALKCGLGPIAICDGPSWGPGCGSARGPTCGSPCQGECGPSCESSCDPFDGPPVESCVGPSGGPCGPLSWVLGLLHPEAWCGGSCGEKYWSDFHSEPPDCRDPCDNCGNFTGMGPAGCTSGCTSPVPAGHGGSCCGGSSGYPSRTIPAAEAFSVSEPTQAVKPRTAAQR